MNDDELWAATASVAPAPFDRSCLEKMLEDKRIA